jgi:hypothetical protein
VAIPLFGARGAGAGIAQPLKAVMSTVIVLPDNVYPGAGGLVHFHGFWGRYGHNFQYRISFALIR